VPFDGDKIVGAPVVDIAASGAAPARVIMCARCHGHCVAGTRFCKYCGAPLEEGAPAPRVRMDPPPSSPRTEIGKVPLVPVSKPSFGSGVRAGMVPPPPPQEAAPSPPVPVAAQEVVAAPKPVHNGAADPRPRPAPEPAPARVVVNAGASAAAEAGVRAEVSVLAGSPVPPDPAPAPRDGGTVRLVPGRWKGGRLVVIVEDGSEGRSFSLAEGQLDIGRTDGDIVLEDDPYVSPRHARLRRAEGTWILRDLDSTNRVYVRLRKLHALRDGDLLLLGLEVLQFQTVSDGERGLGHAIQHGTFLFGSPATPRRARLCQRTVEGVIRDVYHLFRDETIIGREVGDIVFTADPFLSRRHAAIRRNPVTSEFALVDLDSSNGTYVAIRGEVAISDGDFLRIGQHLFRVDLG
jgi:pSer/pThr/pTyr-binding forkhead associated (FHA) protein